MFPFQEVSPEEYVARHSHCIGCFSLHRYVYRSPQLTQWIRRVGEILSSPEETDRCRRELLTPEEYAAVQRAVADSMEHGL